MPSSSRGPQISLVSHRGLADILRRHYSGWIVYPGLAGLLVANTDNAGADLGAIGAGVQLLVPIPSGVVVVVASALLVALLISGSYKIVENVFKPLTLALLAYIGSDALARPDWTTARWQDRAIDVGAGMVFSNIITYFVSLATAATLNAQGQTDVQLRGGCRSCAGAACRQCGYHAVRGWPDRGGRS